MLLHEELTSKIIRAYYNVYNSLGYGFLELKASTLCEAHECQLINYLKASNKEVGLLLSFDKEPKIIRKIFPNSKK